MLVLSRKLNETICLGDNIQIKIVKIRGSVVGLGITAPENVKVMRKELLDRDKQSSAAKSTNVHDNIEVDESPSTGRSSSHLRPPRRVSVEGALASDPRPASSVAPESAKHPPLSQFLLHAAS